MQFLSQRFRGSLDSLGEDSSWRVHIMQLPAPVPWMEGDLRALTARALLGRSAQLGCSGELGCQPCLHVLVCAGSRQRCSRASRQRLAASAEGNGPPVPLLPPGARHPRPWRPVRGAMCSQSWSCPRRRTPRPCCPCCRGGPTCLTWSRAGACPPAPCACTAAARAGPCSSPACRCRSPACLRGCAQRCLMRAAPAARVLHGRQLLPPPPCMECVLPPTGASRPPALALHAACVSYQWLPAGALVS